MNKKMEKLYADINSLHEWVEDLEVKRNENSENEETYSMLMTQISFRVLDLMAQIDVEREIYHNQPLWKKLIKKVI
ncbi:hypothetical protein PP914_gp050 [Arthrobacter phage Qui]|uniref:Uncharacterized protein n=1 Tax=Arthrobacter phage Qui TaxID=2603260 RepID=A0A5B8WFH7_9CAUD|nr:hypothetical protein PP914_gp050 [Arthrobacter phage Qui]QED11540.1 hypothetical protein SEA_QUI_50 [Arthrobacter phage Qui]QOC56372.1 hypothetical protein SEA_PAELLA_50 [Arthrobacter phage Paella]